MRPHGRILLESAAPARIKNRSTTFSGNGQRFQYTYDAVGVKFSKDGNVMQSYTYALSEIGGGVVLRRSDNKHH